MKLHNFRNGFVMLVTVLVIGTVAAASAAALLLLGLSIERNSYAIQLSSQALAGAWSCAERAVAKLQENIDYGGNEPFDITLPNGTVQECRVYPLNGDGNFDRVLCTEATFGDFTERRLHIRINRVWPTTEIESWKEVAQMPTECGTYTGTTAACNGGHECDDGNAYNNDGCSAVCEIEFCGDGVIQAGEQCDDGKAFCPDGTTACDSNADCAGLVCTLKNNDGRFCIGGTTPGSACTLDQECAGGRCGQPCSNACRIEYCGDGDEQTGEQCDEGTDGIAPDNSNDPDGVCTLFCTDAPNCGDSIIQTGEECDNGGTCQGGGSDTLACADNRDCPGGTCEPEAGDGCDATCQEENPPAPPGPSTGPIMYWPLDDNNSNIEDMSTETPLVDYDGQKISSPDWDSSDKATLSFTNSYSLHFDGNNDYVRGEDDDELFPQQFTASFWVKNDADSTFVTSNSSWSDTGILCKSDDDWEDGWGFYFKPVDPSGSTFNQWDGQRRVHFFVEDWNSAVASAPITDVTEWHHIAGTYDGTTITVYVDGIAGADTDTYSGSRDDDEELDAGRCETNSYSLNGRMDDIRFYDYVLTAENIQYLAGGGQ